MIALKTAAMLANGAGAIDWAGLPVAVALFGVRDVTGLVERLRVIVRHDPQRAAADESGAA
jgi:hypothetical protein